MSNRERSEENSDSSSVASLALETQKQELVVRLQWLLLVILVGAAACEILALAGAWKNPLEMITEINHVYALPLLGLAGLQIASVTHTRQMVVMVLLAVLVTLLLHGLKSRVGWHHEVARDLNSSLGLTLCQGFGLASILEMGVRALFSQGTERTNVLLYLLPCSVIVAFALLSPFALGLSTIYNERIFDGIAFAADYSFGGPVSFLAGQWLERLPVLKYLCLAAYNTNALSFLFVYAMQLRQQPLPACNVLPAIVLGSVAIVPLFYFFPVCEPRVVHQAAFPHSPPALDEAHANPFPLNRTGDPSTDMPSLHTTIVLLAWWYSRGLPRWCQYLSVSWLLLTMVATVGFGFHYLVDLIVAVPFSLVVIALALGRNPLRSPPVLRSLLVGSALVLGWLTTMRFGLFILEWSPVVPLAFTAATLSVCFFLQNELFHLASPAGDASTIPSPLYSGERGLG